jgi:hypothetical protein
VFTACQEPSCKFGDGKPVMQRVADKAGVPVKWVKLAWYEGWTDCTDEVARRPLSARLFDAQVKARASLEEKREQEADKLRKQREDAEKHAQTTIEEELKLAKAVRQNTMALMAVYQAMMVPLFKSAEVLGRKFISEDISKLTEQEILDRVARMMMLSKGISTLAHEAMALERRRTAGGALTILAASGLPAGVDVGGGMSSPANYPGSVPEAMEYIASAARAFKRAAEKGLVPVTGDTPAEVVALMRQEVVDMMPARSQSTPASDDDDEIDWLEEDDATDSDER